MDHVFISLLSLPSNRWRWLLPALSVFWLSPLFAVELYRCLLNGEVEFRQTPCPAGEQQITEVSEQSRGMTPAEPALRLPQRKTQATQETTEIRPSRQVLNERCWKTAKRLQKVERRLRGGYRASQYDELHRKQDEYEDYLKQFCAD